MSNNNGSRPIIEPIPSTEAAAATQKLTMKGLKLELDDLTNFIESDVLDKITELAKAIDAHNEAFKIVSSNQEAIQQSIDLLAGEIMVLQTGTPKIEDEAAHRGLQPANLKQTLTQTVRQEPEPEPLQIPEPVDAPTPPTEDIQFGKHQHSVLETIADSCIVMNDILLLCKAMKKVPELTDQTRISLLDLAGRRAGIEIQPGMQVRAGVKMIVA